MVSVSEELLANPNFDQHIQMEPLETIRRIPPRVPTQARFKDALQREIDVGDVITYVSGGYYSHFTSFAIVTGINEAQRFLRLINHNGNKTCLWRTWLCIIIAKYYNYELIPDRYKSIFGIG